jgi:hypothetical protein
MSIKIPVQGLLALLGWLPTLSADAIGPRHLP